MKKTAKAAAPKKPVVVVSPPPAPQEKALSKKKPEATKKAKPRGRPPSKTGPKGPPPAWTFVNTGDRLGVYWDLDKIYYPGTVEAIKGPRAFIIYDDGEREMVDLSRNKFFRWKEGLNKHLRPPMPSQKVEDLQAAENKARPSPNNSVHTMNSTESEIPRQHVLMKVPKSPVKFEGTYKKRVAAAVPSLAEFLLRKIELKRRRLNPPMPDSSVNTESTD